MSKADHPPPCMAIIQSTKGLKITKRWRKGGLTGSPIDCVSWAIYLLPFVPLSLRPSDPTSALQHPGFQTTPAAFLGLQVADHGTSQPLYFMS